MALDAALQHHLERLLGAGSESDGKATRMLDDARRLSGRIHRFILLNLVAPEIDGDAMELSCYAWQLPLKQPRLQVGKSGQINLRDRADQAAELVIGISSERAGTDLPERAAQILRELPARPPTRPESKLLADAVNLDDFGVTGLVLAAMQITRQQGGITAVADGFEKRRQYGYWEARLKDGFNFEPVRQMARRRLETAERVADLLLGELREDQST